MANLVPTHTKNVEMFFPMRNYNSLNTGVVIVIKIRDSKHGWKNNRILTEPW